MAHRIFLIFVFSLIEQLSGPQGLKPSAKSLHNLRDRSFCLVSLSHFFPDVPSPSAAPRRTRIFRTELWSEDVSSRPELESKPAPKFF
jgi:hypothetical protein